MCIFCMWHFDNRSKIINNSLIFLQYNIIVHDVQVRDNPIKCIHSFMERFDCLWYKENHHFLILHLWPVSRATCRYFQSRTWTLYPRTYLSLTNIGRLGVSSRNLFSWIVASFWSSIMCNSSLETNMQMNEPQIPDTRFFSFLSKRKLNAISDSKKKKSCKPIIRQMFVESTNRTMF